MDSFSENGPASPNVWLVGSRRVEFHAVEASAFIGRWSESTSSIECLRPRRERRTRPRNLPSPATPTLSTIVCDVVIAISALIMIFCIPGLVLYSTMSH